MKPNFFNTLNDALESENLIDLWPLGSNINYNETISHVVGEIFISVYRNDVGRYERPIHYNTMR